MATTLTQARKLLTAAELEVFVASREDALKAMTPTQLRAKTKRARTLRDKYQDLLRRQKLSTRDRVGTKGGRTGVANARTGQKAQLFADVLERFDRCLTRVEEAASRSAKQSADAKPKEARQTKRHTQKETPSSAKSARSPKAPSKGPVGAANVGRTNESARVARHAMQPKMAGQQKVHAHVASRGRRNQAKRDGKR